MYGLKSACSKQLCLFSLPVKEKILEWRQQSFNMRFLSTLREDRDSTTSSVKSFSLNTVKIDHIVPLSLHIFLEIGQNTFNCILALLNLEPSGNDTKKAIFSFLKKYELILKTRYSTFTGIFIKYYLI